MADTITYILDLKDKISGKLKIIGINNDKQLSTWAKVQQRVNEASSTMNEMGRCIGSLNERITALRARKEWIPASNRNAIRATNHEIQRLEREVQKLNNLDGGKMKKWVSDITSSIPVFINPITFAIGGIGKTIKIGMEDELQKQNITSLMGGDTIAADKLFGQITDYGKNTVYDKGGLIESQKTMMSFGLSSDFAFDKLKQIGDIAMGDSQKMQSLALAFSQASSAGKLQGQDLMQMINAGFNPLNIISEKTGKSMAQLKEEMSKGQISAEMLSQSFQWATEEGALFYQGAETAAQTTAGRIAEMKDTIDEMKVSLFEATSGATAYIAEIGQMIVPLAQLSPLFKAIGSSIKWCKDKWSSFVKGIKTGVLKVGWDLGIMKYSIASAGGMFKFLSLTAKSACRSIGVAIMNIPIIGWIAAAIAAIIAVVKILWDKSEGFRRVVMGVWESIKAIFHNVRVVIKGVFQFIWEGIIKPYFMLWKTILTTIRWKEFQSIIKL